MKKWKQGSRKMQSPMLSLSVQYFSADVIEITIGTEEI